MPSMLYINEKQVKALRRMTPEIHISNQHGSLQLKFTVLPRKIRSAKMKKQTELEQPTFNQASQITTGICQMETKIMFQIWNRGKIQISKCIDLTKNHTFLNHYIWFTAFNLFWSNPEGITPTQRKRIVKAVIIRYQRWNRLIRCQPKLSLWYFVCHINIIRLEILKVYNNRLYKTMWKLHEILVKT